MKIRADPVKHSVGSERTLAALPAKVRYADEADLRYAIKTVLHSPKSQGRLAMPKGYWIVNIEVTDAETYENYKSAAATAIAAHGGRYLVRGDANMEVREGEMYPRPVVIEFDSVEAARACYESAEYQAAMVVRQRSANSRFAIVNGVPD